MELLDRYLEAVKKHLPWQRQDDILAELKANLESQLEDKETELGRPLTSAEAEAWLKQLGSPIQMAARYQPQQYLIGPAVFPTYWYVLRLALGWAMVIYGIVSVILVATQSATANAGAHAAAEAIARTPGILMTVAAWVTLLFAIAEFVGARYPGKMPAFASHAVGWSPETLPPLDRSAVQGKARSSYANAVAEVIFGFIFLVWLLLIPSYPILWLGPAANFVHTLPYVLAPVWWQFYWWMVGLNVLQLAWHCYDLVRGRWREPRPMQHIVFKVVGLVAIGLLLGAPEGLLVLPNPAAVDKVPYGATLSATNHGIHVAMLVVFAVVVAQLALDLGRMILDIYRKRAAAM